MRFEDLKVGDKVYIREDLKVGNYYGGCVYEEEKKSGRVTIRNIKNFPFSVPLSKYFTVEETSGEFMYTSEMIDWEKTTSLNIEDIIQEVMGEEPYKGFLYGNAIKYILRAYKKNGVEDLEKARKYIGWLILQEK